MLKWSCLLKWTSVNYPKNHNISLHTWRRSMIQVSYHWKQLKFYPVWLIVSQLDKVEFSNVNCFRKVTAGHVFYFLKRKSPICTIFEDESSVTRGLCLEICFARSSQTQWCQLSMDYCCYYAAVFLVCMCIWLAYNIVLF